MINSICPDNFEHNKQRQLARCLTDILSNYKYPAPIVLRPVLDGTLFNGADVDVLYPADYVALFLNEVLAFTQKQGLHRHIQAYSIESMSVTIYSPCFSEHIELNIHVILRQLGDHTKYVCWEDVSASVSTNEHIHCLSGPAGAALYLSHLRSMKKDLHAKNQAARLKWFSENTPVGEMQQVIQRVYDKRQLPSGEEIDSLVTVFLPHRSVNRSRLFWSQLTRNLQKTVFRTQRKLKLAYLVGCDGVGKTTLGENAHKGSLSILHIRHFYRKTPVYKFAKRIGKKSHVPPEVLLPRGFFLFSLLTLFMLLLAKQLRIVTRRYLVDRSPYDLLVPGRHGDATRVVWGAMSCARIVRLTPLIAIVTHDGRPMSDDQDEMSPRAVSVYSQAMRSFGINSFPVNYMQYCNRRKGSNNTLAFDRCLRKVWNESET